MAKLIPWIRYPIHHRPRYRRFVILGNVSTGPEGDYESYPRALLGVSSSSSPKVRIGEGTTLAASYYYHYYTHHRIDKILAWICIPFGLRGGEHTQVRSREIGTNKKAPLTWKLGAWEPGAPPHNQISSHPKGKTR